MGNTQPHPSPPDDLPARVVAVTETLLAHMGVPASVYCRDHRGEDAPHVWVEIMTEESGLLIGERGAHLHALEYVLRRLLRGTLPAGCRCLLDVNTYRLRRIEFIKTVARESARRARRSRHAVALDPMSASERRVVHMTLVDDGGVETSSVGVEPQRRVIIRPRDPLLTPAARSGERGEDGA